MSLWNTEDIAREYGVKRRTVTNKWTKRPDFPAPVQRISRRLVRWDSEAVQRWAKAEPR